MVPFVDIISNGHYRCYLMALVCERIVPKRTQEFYDACDELGLVEPRLEAALVFFWR